MAPRGAVAEWLGRGLQSLVHQFESGRRLFHVVFSIVAGIIPLVQASRMRVSSSWKPTETACMLWLIVAAIVIGWLAFLVLGHRVVISP